MFGLKRLKYRQTVETNLSYLVGLNEPYFQKLYTSFNGIRGVIDASCDKARDPMDLAVELWGIMFSYEIERTPILREHGESIIEYLNTGGDGWRWDTELAMRVFIIQADKQAIMKRVNEGTVEIAVDEIVGALRGISREERARQRLIDLTNRTFRTSLDEA